MPHHFQVGVKGIYIQNNKALLLKFKRPDASLTWDLPGGRIDRDESIADAFTREVNEEINGIMQVQLRELLHAARAPGNFDDGTGLIWLFYSCHIDFTQLQLRDEHIGIKWATSQDLTWLAKDMSITLNQDFHLALTRAFDKRIALPTPKK